MVELKDDTENRIFEAAKEEFIENGMAGARMQAIADRAGINKSLLHYYFRSKEKLFASVFKMVFNQIFPKIEKTIMSDRPLEEKIREFVGNYIDIISSNPFLPIFVLHELNKNPNRLAELIRSLNIKSSQFISEIQEALNKENIISVEAKHLLINTVALSIFPVIAKPILQQLIFSGDKKAFKDFLKERKTEVPKFIINALKPCQDD